MSGDKIVSRKRLHWKFIVCFVPNIPKQDSEDRCQRTWRTQEPKNPRCFSSSYWRETPLKPRETFGFCLKATESHHLQKGREAVLRFPTRSIKRSQLRWFEHVFKWIQAESSVHSSCPKFCTASEGLKRHAKRSRTTGNHRGQCGCRCLSCSSSVVKEKWRSVLWLCCPLLDVLIGMHGCVLAVRILSL